MPLDARYFEENMQERLGLPVFFALSQEPLPPEELSSREKEIYVRQARSLRLDSWLRGRAALKRLLFRLGEDIDTAGIYFPHPTISLSHSGNSAVAAYAAPGRTSGLGIDFELSRTLRPGTERFFLTEREQRWMRALRSSMRHRELLRLWTIKEALFKANPANRDSLLGHYDLCDPGPLAGQAKWKGDNGTFYRYATIVLDDGFLTIAVRP